MRPIPDVPSQRLRVIGEDRSLTQPYRARWFIGGRPVILRIWPMAAWMRLPDAEKPRNAIAIGPLGWATLTEAD